MRRPLLVVIVPSVLVATFFAALVDGAFAWWCAGLWTGGVVVMAMWVWDDPPEHVARWGRGASGEERTGKELHKLARDGWSVEHDRQMGKYNLDHIAVGPSGRYLIETKTTTGTASIEDGVFTVRMTDDPEAVWSNWKLGRRMRERATELWRELKTENGERRWVHAVVVVWGSFPQDFVHHDRVTFLHGDRLIAFLRDPDEALSSHRS
jgi:hypothetical protein